MVLHSGNMSSPSELVLQWHSLNAEHPGLSQNFNVRYEATPANIEDGAETALGEMYVIAVGDPSLSATEESGKYHGL